jgi:hypothetical protein
VLEFFALLSVLLLLAIFVRLGRLIEEIGRFRAEWHELQRPVANLRALDDDTVAESDAVDPEREVYRPADLVEMRTYYRGAKSPRSWSVTLLGTDAESSGKS